MVSRSITRRFTALVQAYAPELGKRIRPHLRLTNDSYRVDETYVKIKGKWKYLYRAVDSTGQTIGFMLSAKRDARAVKRFFRKMLKAAPRSSPRVINVDKNPAYPPAVEELKKEGVLAAPSQLRQRKHLNNIVEQNHRFIKLRVNAGLGFFSFNTAWRTIREYESMNMIRKGQIARVGRREIPMQVKFVSNLFGIVAYIGVQLGLFTSLFIFLQHNPCRLEHVCDRDPKIFSTRELFAQ